MASELLLFKTKRIYVFEEDEPIPTMAKICLSVKK